MPFSKYFATLALVAVAAAKGPCDILAAAGNPCVAAHSTVRALYEAYDGPLYNVTRSSDDQSALIGVLSSGGFANKSAHDQFCSKLDCVISNVMDQSGLGNHLGRRHKLVNASWHPITVGKDKTPVYGMWFGPGYGYHVDNTTSIATDNDPESIYAVMSGKNFNGRCCFDYGECCFAITVSVVSPCQCALSLWLWLGVGVGVGVDLWLGLGLGLALELGLR